MIVVHTTIPVDPDRREELLDRVEALVDHAREAEDVQSATFSAEEAVAALD